MRTLSRFLLPIKVHNEPIHFCGKLIDRHSATKLLVEHRRSYLHFFEVLRNVFDKLNNRACRIVGINLYQPVCYTLGIAAVFLFKQF